MNDPRDHLSAIESSARDLLAERLTPAATPDFADVIGRMQDLGAEEDDLLIGRARDLDQDEPLTETMSAGELAELAAINADARSLLDAALDERRLASIPAVQLPRKRGRWTWAAAAAIVLIAGVAGATSLVRSYSSDQAATDHTGFEAEDRAVPDDNGGRTQTNAPVTHEATVKHPDPEERPTVVVEDSASEPPPPAAPSPAQKTKADDLDAKLARLDAEAQDLWRKRDLAGAEKKFRTIVRLGGRSEYAQQAYGELFAIAHQTHGPAEQEKLWRAYLRRFPRGRYADSASAGLCRGEPKSNKKVCWTRYLDQHPRGAARREALKALDELP